MNLDADVQVTLGALELKIELSVAQEEVLVLLGPNGAGKTTLLRVIAGLTPLDAGHIRLDGQLLEDPVAGRYVPTEKRSIGFVFQDYLLFPHMSVEDNVAFGLRSRGLKRAPARQRARFWLDRVGLAAYGAATPAHLSGGQRQRVALARALAPEPRVLLLDEPLAALDVTTRAEVRRELKRHLGSFAGLRLVVTHDPVEAAILADRLAVIEAGRLVQTGTPAEVTERPRSQYVADLVGINLIRGRAERGAIRITNGRTIAAAAAESGDVLATIHPRAVALHRDRPQGSPRNVWPARIAALERLGERVRVRLQDHVPIVAEITSSAVTELALAEGREVWLSFKATDVGVYPA
jgi:molybdate transport system ATP-binding protein